MVDITQEQIAEFYAEVQKTKTFKAIQKEVEANHEDDKDEDDDLPEEYWEELVDAIHDLLTGADTYNTDEGPDRST